MARRLVCIGGVAGGMSAAAKAKRTDPDLEVVDYEKGGHVSFAACGLPYFLEGLVGSAEALVVRTPEQLRRQGVEARVHHEVTRVDLERRELEVRDLVGGRTLVDRFDALVIATGASPVVPPIEGVDQDGVHTLRSIEQGLAIAEGLERAKHTVVVGAGYVGLELAEAFRVRGKVVTVVEAAETVYPMGEPEVSGLLRDELDRHEVTVLTGTRVTGLGGSGRVTSVETTVGSIPAELVVLAVGIRPNTMLAETLGVALGPTGAVEVDEQCRTSVPDVFAAGDVAESRHLVTGEPTWLPLGDVANKHGRVAGTVAAGGRARFLGVAGTAVMRAFDLSVGTTGLTEAEAGRAGLEVRTVVVAAHDKAHYYPGWKRVHVKLVFEAGSGRLLGAQVAGAGDVAKRVDVVSALIAKRGTVEDLAACDLAYAPPFSPVWDPLLVAANQAVKG